LAVWTFLGMPWIVNALLGVASLLAVYWLARRHFSIEAANISLLLLAVNPFFVFNNASYYPHTACLLFVVLCLHLVFVCSAETGAKIRFAALGLCAGVGMSMRPYSIVAVLAVPAAYLLWNTARREDRRSLLTALVAALLPFLACVGLVLVYNKAQTGDAFL